MAMEAAGLSANLQDAESCNPWICNLVLPNLLVLAPLVQIIYIFFICALRL